MIVGASVFGLQFDKGVLLAADTTGYYGSMAMYRDLNRILRVNDYTVAGCSGDQADFQYLSSVIKQKQLEMERSDYDFSPKALHTWLTRVSYNRRSKMQPLMTTWVVAGIDPSTKEFFIGFVDHLGTAYTDVSVCTGFAQQIVKPLFRDLVEKKNGALPTESEARNLIEAGAKALYARDARSWNKLYLAVVKKDPQDKVTSTIEGPLEVEVDWRMADMVPFDLA